MTLLWVGGYDWGHLAWHDSHDDWNERVAPGRYIFKVELVDEGTARLLTLHRKVALAKPPAVVPWWQEEGPCRWCADFAPVYTAIYVPISEVPTAILQRMHP